MARDWLSAWGVVMALSDIPPPPTLIRRADSFIRISALRDLPDATWRLAEYR